MELELNPEGLSLGQRMSRMFTNPSSVFADLKRDHSWLLALLITTVVSLAAILPLIPKIQASALIMLQKMPDNPLMANPEALAFTTQVTAVTTIIGVLLAPVGFALIMALLLKLFNAFAGDKVPYRKLFSACVYAYLPVVLASLIQLGLGLTSSPESFGNISTSLYLFFPPESYSFAAMLASHIDPFSLWSLYLVALGGAILMKIKPGKTVIFLFSLWLVFAVVSSYFSSLQI